MFSNFGFLDLSTPDLVIILVIILLLFGGRKLPELSKSIGESMRELKKGVGGSEDEAQKGKEKPTEKKAEDIHLTFREHLQELRKRLFYVALSIGLWSIITYIFERQTIKALLRPANHQQFIYTSPIGGVDFMFRVSLYVAFILSLPVIVYNVLAFIKPLLSGSSRRFITFGALASGILAACGLVFGYFIGLPSALHFLLHQFVTSEIKPLLTIQSYLSFVMVYMVGSALMLQIPLILIFINRIKPLKPRTLFHYERWVIVGAFVLSAIMDPTPNVLDLLMVAGPLIIMYQIGIAIIAFINRGNDNEAPANYVSNTDTEPDLDPKPEPMPAPRPLRPPSLRLYADIIPARPRGRLAVSTPPPRFSQARPINRPYQASSGRPKTMDVVGYRQPKLSSQQAL